MAGRHSAGGQRPLPPQAAIRKLREALTLQRLRYSRHVRERMIQPDRDFDLHDIRKLVLHVGVVRRPPELDIRFGTWEYVVEGDDVDGRPLELVFAIGEGHVTLLTGRRPRGRP